MRKKNSGKSHIRGTSGGEGSKNEAIGACPCYSCVHSTGILGTVSDLW